MENRDNLNVTDFIPSQYLKRLMRWWWLIASCCVVGGLLGFLVAKIHGGIFESNAVITTAIDYAYSNRLDDAEEDHLVTAIGNIIGSAPVVEEVRMQASMEGYNLTDADFFTALRLSRQGFSWQLSSRFTDPVKAQRIAQLWLESAIDALTRMQEDSQEGLKQLSAQNAYEDCLSQSVVLEPASNTCSVDQLKALWQEVELVTTTELQRTLLSSIRLSRISFQNTQTPQLPEKPVLYHSNLATLIGAISGFLVGLLVFLTGFPK